VTLFRRSNDVEVSVSPEFDKEYKPDETPIHTGIYRCRGCGCEIRRRGQRAVPAGETSQALAVPRDNPMATGCRGTSRTALGVRLHQHLPAGAVARFILPRLV
jgi:hypothetical protein